jgi:hypothetical protein
MNNSNLQVDPVALAYLQQATKEIVSEQGYKPSSTQDFMVWLEDNHLAISKRASHLNQEFYLKFIRDKALILSVLCAKIYYKSHRQLLLEKEAECIDRVFKDEYIDRASD